MNNPWDKINIPTSDIFSRRVNASHPLNLFWAKDPYGHFLFVYEFSTPDFLPNKLPTLNGISVHLLTPEQNHTEKFMLILMLKDKNDWQIFLSLCFDVINATSDFEKHTQATKIILRRLKRWQEFLQRSRSGLLPEAEIKGLIGELLFIDKHLEPEFGITQAIDYWQGPDDLPQDFNVENCAIEIKCQLGTTAPRVKISSTDQLCSQLPKMYLHIVTLGKADPDAESAVNLPTLIATIRQQLETDNPSSFERFNNLLYQTGYMDTDEYLQFSYLLVSEQMFEIKPGFPRICPETLIQGVEKVSYDINLHDCQPFSATPNWIKLS